MKTVAAAEAQAKLHWLLAEVAAGERVTITEDGRPVAVLMKAEEPVRKFGQFCGVISIPDDFDAPMGNDALVSWGEGQ